MEKLGIENLKEVIDLAIEGTKAGFEVMKDGKVGFEDAATLMRLVPYMGPAFAGINSVPAEFKDVDADEAKELITHISAKLVVDDKKAQVIIAHSLKIASAAYALYLEGKALKDALDALKAPAPVV